MIVCTRFLHKKKGSSDVIMSISTYHNACLVVGLCGIAVIHTKVVCVFLFLATKLNYGMIYFSKSAPKVPCWVCNRRFSNSRVRGITHGRN